MSTYLSGVTDFIPQIQPFQPDLNFYQNVMSTKQNQYDSNWKSLNKMYGQYYYADLTRDPNIEKRNSYLKNAEFELKRVSQLDLSLEQNVTQATQIFKPLYEDKNIMKDMAWTKNRNNQLNKSEIYRNSSNPNDQKQYWSDGVKAIQYLSDEFKNASDEEALNFQNAEYVPYVNTVERAQKIAKEANLSIEKVDFSNDGRWIVKTKNGEALTEPLQKLFEAQLGADPGIQSVYKVQAYVNRKDYAYGNAAMFGGDKLKAEMTYLENTFNVLKQQNIARHQDLTNQSKAYEGKIENIKKQIKEGTASPEAEQQLQQYILNKDINDKVLARSQEEINILNGGQSSTPSTTTGFTNPYGDLATLRHKVDNGMASLLMQKDLDEAAHIFAYTNAKEDIEANPYAVISEKHKNSMQEIASRNAGLANAARIRNAGERQSKLDEYRLKAGTHYINEETGEVVPVEALNEVYIEQDDKGTSTANMNMKTASNHIVRMHTENVAKPYLNNTLLLMKRLVAEGSMTQSEASKILSYSKNPNATIGSFSAKLNKYGSEWLRNSVGTNDMIQIQQRMNKWINQNGQQSGLSSTEYLNYQKTSAQFNDYAGYLKLDSEWRKETSQQVETELKRKGFTYANYLYDPKGNLRSKGEFENALKAVNLFKSGIDYEDMVKNAGVIYSSGKIKNAPPGFAQYGSMNGSGKFTKGQATTWVNPKAHGAKSSIIFGDLLHTLHHIDWGDTTKNKVTIGGISKTAYDLAPSSRNQLGLEFLGKLQAEMSNPKTKMENFRISVSPIAAGSLNKAAVVIKPDAAWLKSYVRTGKDGTGPGFITPEQYNMIMTHGISYITNSNNLSGNSLYRQSFQSPLASQVDVKKSYTYTDPTNPNYKFIISKDALTGGDYNFTVGFPLWNPEKNKYEYIKTQENMTTYGANIETARDNIFEYWESIKAHNKLSHNGNY